MSDLANHIDEQAADKATWTASNHRGGGMRGIGGRGERR
jgi:hypothetical protein